MYYHFVFLHLLVDGGGGDVFAGRAMRALRFGNFGSQPEEQRANLACKPNLMLLAQI
jgi:hypothetical protein